MKQHWATAADYETQNALEDVLATRLDLRLLPECVGRNSNGYLGDGEVDAGFVDLDDLEFFRDP
jgi:hypothetical protein